MLFHHICQKVMDQWTETINKIYLMDSWHPLIQKINVKAYSEKSNISKHSPLNGLVLQFESWEYNCVHWRSAGFQVKSISAWRQPFSHSLSQPMFSRCMRLHAQWAALSRFKGVSWILNYVLFHMITQHQLNSKVDLSHQNHTIVTFL